MTRLRPTTARAVASYPEVPVRYHRPFLRAVAGAFLVGSSVLGISLMYFPDGEDDLVRGDWYLHLMFLVMLGGLYLYVASSVVVTRTGVVVSNPFRRAEIPLTQILQMVPGSNLRIRTAHRDFVAAGVEAANVQSESGVYGTQGDLAGLIDRAAAAARGGDAVEPAARYRFAWPDPLFLGFAVVHLVNAVVLLVHGRPLPL